MRPSERPVIRAASAVERLCPIARGRSPPLLRGALARRLLRRRLGARRLGLAGLAAALRQALLQRGDEIDDLLARSLARRRDDLLARDLAVARLQELDAVAVPVPRRVGRH